MKARPVLLYAVRFHSLEWGPVRCLVRCTSASLARELAGKALGPINEHCPVDVFCVSDCPTVEVVGGHPVVRGRPRRIPLAS